MAEGGQDFLKIFISISTEEDCEKKENDSDVYRSKNVSHHCAGGSISNK